MQFVGLFCFLKMLPNLNEFKKLLIQITIWLKDSEDSVHFLSHLNVFCKGLSMLHYTFQIEDEITPNFVIFRKHSENVTKICFSS